MLFQGVKYSSIVNAYELKWNSPCKKAFEICFFLGKFTYNMRVCYVRHWRMLFLAFVSSVFTKTTCHGTVTHSNIFIEFQSFA